MGVAEGRYIGGRLLNYAAGEDIQALARRVHGALQVFSALPEARSGAEPYALALALEKRKEEIWPK